MSNKFKCKKCGSEELAYRSYAKCLIPVVIREDGSIEYLKPVVDCDDYIHNTGHYCCSGCGSPAGNYLRSEQELLEYLSSHKLNHD